MRLPKWTPVLAVLLSLHSTAATAQPARQYTAEDYARAEAFMPYNTTPLLLHAVESPTWLPDGRVWYRDTGTNGVAFTLVDPAKGSKAPAFDPVKVAAALKPLGLTTPIDAKRLPIREFTLTDADQTLNLVIAGQLIRCNLGGEVACVKAGLAIPSTRQRRKPAGGFDISPDGTKGAFIRNWNLWLRDLKTTRETQLTTDGVKNYGYATDNAGWQHSENPILVWSPNSKRIATFQQDQRKTGELYLTNVTYGHPTLTTLKYPLVGDKDVTMIERVIIDLPTSDSAPAKLVRLKMPPDQHRSSLCDDISCKGGSGWDDVQWSADSKTLAFVSTARDHRQEWMRLANPETGDVRDVMSESAPKFFESGNDKVNWHYLSATNQLLWFSERENWGHLYLYDVTTGKQIRQITSGDWNVTQVLGIDEPAKVIYFLGVGREPGNDPYFPMYYRVDFDGQHLQLLTPERAAHTITPSPDNRFFVDTYSTPNVPQTTVVRDATGKIIVNAAHEDLRRLEATGWIPPLPIQVKARDGQTDLYGLMFRPTNFSTEKHYPLINHVYPGPQTGSCGPRTFSAAHGDMQSLAELGFIVVCIDGMGTPFRSKAFHEFYYADLGDNTIPDQVAGMKQLAERYPWIDAKRMGIYGHSGGGNATAAAMFHFPDFFKAGIAESGNHDERNYEDDWAEKWSGLLVKNPDGTSNYDSQANEATAKNLKGHLLLAHGTVDDNVPPSNTLLLVDALIKANKDFDLLMIPNVRHGYAEAAQYMTRRRWDYFIRYLADATPPLEYAMRDYAQTQLDLDQGPANLDWTLADTPEADLTGLSSDPN